VSDRCPTCGQKLKHRKGGPVFEKIKAALEADGRDEWTTEDLARAAGLGVNKPVYNAIDYMVRIGTLQRLYRGAFVKAPSTTKE
jgi:hypothetical protein